MLHRARHPYLVNAVLAVALATPSVLATATWYGLLGNDPVRAKKLATIFGDAAGLHHAMALWWLCTGLILAGLLLQHRWPLLALTLAGAGAAGHQLGTPTDFEAIDFAVVIVLYTVATMATSRRVSVTALTVTLLGNYLLTLRGQLMPPMKGSGAGLPGPRLAHFQATDLLDAAAGSYQAAVLLVLAFALGDGLRSRRAHLRSLEQRAAALEREQHQRATLAAAAERARLTRELHDVVAHGLSVMVVQAQGAAAALDRHPERTATALRQVIDTGRASLTEMRRLLGMARRDPADDPRLVPQPGVGALPELVDQVRAAGTAVELRIDGDPVPLPAGVDLSAYRIVQEALTNTIKHAGPGARAVVRLDFADGGLAVEITDSGRGPTAARPPVADESSDGGCGLRGIAERVSLLDGELAVGPADGAGFRVHARLPIRAG